MEPQFVVLKAIAKIYIGAELPRLSARGQADRSAVYTGSKTFSKPAEGGKCLRDPSSDPDQHM